MLSINSFHDFFPAKLLRLGGVFKEVWIFFCLSCFLSITLAQRPITYLKHLDHFGIANGATSVLSVPEGFLLFSNIGLYNAAYTQATLHVLVNDSGEVIQEHFFGKPDEYWFSGSYNSVIPTQDGNIFCPSVIQYYDSTKEEWITDQLFVKANTKGDTLWTKRYAFPDFIKIYNALENPDSTFLMIGEIFTQLSPVVKANLILIKTSNQGDTLWTRQHGGHFGDGGRSIIPSPHGYMISGIREYPLGINVPWNLLIDTNGNKLHEWVYPKIGKDCSSVINPSYGNGFLMTTCYQDSLINLGDDPMANMNISRLGITGQVEWTTWLNSPFRVSIFDFMELPDSTIILAGQKYGRLNDGWGRGWIAKLDKTGKVLWERWHAPCIGCYTYIWDIEPSPDGGFFCTGATIPPNGTQDILLLKVDDEGCVEPGCPNRLGAVGVEAPVATSGLSLHLSPNPAADHIRLELHDLTGIRGELRWEIHDLWGNIVRTGGMSRQRVVEERIELDGVAVGMYMLVVKADGRRLVAEKFVVGP